MRLFFKALLILALAVGLSACGGGKFRKYNGAGPKARAYATQQMKRLNTL